MPVDDAPAPPAGILADAAGHFAHTAPHPRLRGHIQRIWRNRVAADLRAPLVIVPDARIDLIWAGGELFVAGPDTGPAIAHVPAGARVIGFQFGAAAANALLRVPMERLRDARVDFAEFAGTRARDLTARAADAADERQALAVLQRGLIALLGDAPLPDRRLQRVYARLQSDNGDGASAGAIAREAGLSERSLRRRSLDAFGYGPRTLARVLRFGRFMQAMRARRAAPLAELALELGYADQAHMNREVASFSGCSPGEVRRQLGGDLAVSFKTAPRR
ncbi:helix-turn-helix domain-containing protein [Pseudomonas sp. CGJS7]|uniref:helix-turn-helix domain-containing protein n=1 Tax=Pseudomonas sp. CGJS7 TaxID=3109348 RepID=UPI00300B62BC